MQCNCSIPSYTHMFTLYPHYHLLPLDIIALCYHLEHVVSTVRGMEMLALTIQVSCHCTSGDIQSERDSLLCWNVLGVRTKLCSWQGNGTV